jgi:hypothetical protein
MKSKTFKIFELVPVHLYQIVHEDSLWDMMDDKLIESIDLLKEKFPNGTMVINNYQWGGERGWSGLRTKDSKYYSEGSQHSIGKAVDCIFSEYTTEEIRNYILYHQDEFPYIGGIEIGVSWLHLDVRDRKNNRIQQFKG